MTLPRCDVPVGYPPPFAATAGLYSHGPPPSAATAGLYSYGPPPSAATEGLRLDLQWLGTEFDRCFVAQSSGDSLNNNDFLPPTGLCGATHVPFADGGRPLTNDVLAVLADAACDTRRL